MPNRKFQTLNARPTSEGDWRQLPDDQRGRALTVEGLGLTFVLGCCPNSPKGLRVWDSGWVLGVTGLRRWSLLSDSRRV